MLQLDTSPEATEMGTIVLGKGHDTISVDTENRRLCLEVSEEELMHGREKFFPPEQEPTAYLKRYMHHVTSGSKGAIFEK